MRQPSIIFLTLALSVLISHPVEAAIRGGINYSIPVDYSKLSEQELSMRGDILYRNLILSSEKSSEKDMSDVLLLYSVLQNINPSNPLYSIRLGVLYDNLGLDRYAKGNLSRAMAVNESNPEPYFRFGEFYYKRELYRRALKYYEKAYKLGYNNYYETLYKLGDINEKLGDTRQSLEYLNKAYLIEPSSSLEKKINTVKNQDKTNSMYYRD